MPPTRGDVFNSRIFTSPFEHRDERDVWKAVELLQIVAILRNSINLFSLSSSGGDNRKMCYTSSNCFFLSIPPFVCVYLCLRVCLVEQQALRSVHHSWIVDPSVHSRIFTMSVLGDRHRETVVVWCGTIDAPLSDTHDNPPEATRFSPTLMLWVKVHQFISLATQPINICWVWCPDTYRIDNIRQQAGTHSTYVSTGRRPNSLFFPHSPRGWPK